MMKPVDFVKALGVAILVMVLDLICAFCTVFIWASLTGQTGLTPADPKVIEISSLSTRICGPLLFALFVWIFQRKRPDRNAWAFALSVFGFYFLIDWSLVAFKGVLEPQVMVTAALKLAGALVGAWLAKRSQS
ncbi:MAG: hypothetical protein J7494_08595 [Sphingobium sp.]|nr:hypothetical protein [Sphingobium sp.]